MKPLLAHAFGVAFIVALAACKPEASAPPSPVALSDEALGHYCQMYVAEHPGPKAQIHLDGYEHPLWFSQVSDAVAFIHDPEKLAPVSAIYVSDMAAAESWAIPGATNWISVDAARFVIDSRQQGGMGVPEAIPFGSETAAAEFVTMQGGRVVRWDEIPEAYVRAPMAMVDETPEDADAPWGRGVAQKEPVQ